MRSWVPRLAVIGIGVLCLVERSEGGVVGVGLARNGTVQADCYPANDTITVRGYGECKDCPGGVISGQPPLPLSKYREIIAQETSSAMDVLTCAMYYDPMQCVPPAANDTWASFTVQYLFLYSMKEDAVGLPENTTYLFPYQVPQEGKSFSDLCPADPGDDMWPEMLASGACSKTAAPKVDLVVQVAVVPCKNWAAIHTPTAPLTETGSYAFDDVTVYSPIPLLLELYDLAGGTLASYSEQGYVPQTVFSGTAEEVTKNLRNLVLIWNDATDPVKTVRVRLVSDFGTMMLDVVVAVSIPKHEVRNVLVEAQGSTNLEDCYPAKDTIYVKSPAQDAPVGEQCWNCPGAMTNQPPPAIYETGDDGIDIRKVMECVRYYPESECMPKGQSYPMRFLFVDFGIQGSTAWPSELLLLENTLDRNFPRCRASDAPTNNTGWTPPAQPATAANVSDEVIKMTCPSSAKRNSVDLQFIVEVPLCPDNVAQFHYWGEDRLAVSSYRRLTGPFAITSKSSSISVELSIPSVQFMDAGVYKDKVTLTGSAKSVTQQLENLEIIAKAEASSTLSMKFTAEVAGKTVTQTLTIKLLVEASRQMTTISVGTVSVGGGQMLETCYPAETVFYVKGYPGCERCKGLKGDPFHRTAPPGLPDGDADEVLVLKVIECMMHYPAAKCTPKAKSLTKQSILLTTTMQDEWGLLSGPGFCPFDDTTQPTYLDYEDPMVLTSCAKPAEKVDLQYIIEYDDLLECPGANVYAYAGPHVIMKDGSLSGRVAITSRFDDLEVEVALVGGMINDGYMLTLSGNSFFVTEQLKKLNKGYKLEAYDGASPHLRITILRKNGDKVIEPVDIPLGIEGGSTGIPSQLRIAKHDNKGTGKSIEECYAARNTFYIKGYPGTCEGECSAGTLDYFTSSPPPFPMWNRSEIDVLQIRNCLADYPFDDCVKSLNEKFGSGLASAIVFLENAAKPQVPWGVLDEDNQFPALCPVNSSMTYTADYQEAPYKTDCEVVKGLQTTYFVEWDTRPCDNFVKVYAYGPLSVSLGGRFTGMVDLRSSIPSLTVDVKIEGSNLVKKFTGTAVEISGHIFWLGDIVPVEGKPLTMVLDIAGGGKTRTVEIPLSLETVKGIEPPKMTAVPTAVPTVVPTPVPSTPKPETPAPTAHPSTRAIRALRHTPAGTPLETCFPASSTIYVKNYPDCPGCQAAHYAHSSPPTVPIISDGDTISAFNAYKCLNDFPEVSCQPTMSPQPNVRFLYVEKDPSFQEWPDFQCPVPDYSTMFKDENIKVTCGSPAEEVEQQYVIEVERRPCDKWAKVYVYGGGLMVTQNGILKGMIGVTSRVHDVEVEVAFVGGTIEGQNKKIYSGTAASITEDLAKGITGIVTTGSVVTVTVKGTISGQNVVILVELPHGTAPAVKLPTPVPDTLEPVTAVPTAPPTAAPITPTTSPTTPAPTAPPSKRAIRALKHTPVGKLLETCFPASSTIYVKNYPDCPGCQAVEYSYAAPPLPPAIDDGDSISAFNAYKCLSDFPETDCQPTMSPQPNVRFLYVEKDPSFQEWPDFQCPVPDYSTIFKEEVIKVACGVPSDVVEQQYVIEVERRPCDKWAKVYVYGSPLLVTADGVLKGNIGVTARVQEVTVEVAFVGGTIGGQSKKVYTGKAADVTKELMRGITGIENADKTVTVTVKEVGGDGRTATVSLPHGLIQKIKIPKAHKMILTVDLSNLTPQETRDRLTAIASVLLQKLIEKMGNSVRNVLVDYTCEIPKSRAAAGILPSDLLSDACTKWEGITVNRRAAALAACTDCQTLVEMRVVTENTVTDTSQVANVVDNIVKDTSGGGLADLGVTGSFKAPVLVVSRLSLMFSTAVPQAQITKRGTDIADVIWKNLTASAVATVTSINVTEFCNIPSSRLSGGPLLQDLSDTSICTPMTITKVSSRRAQVLAPNDYNSLILKAEAVEAGSVVLGFVAALLGIDGANGLKDLGVTQVVMSSDSAPVPTPGPTPVPTVEGEGDESDNPGEIIAIVVAVVVAVILVAVLVACYISSRLKRQAKYREGLERVSTRASEPDFEMPEGPTAEESHHPEEIY